VKVHVSKFKIFSFDDLVAIIASDHEALEVVVLAPNRIANNVEFGVSGDGVVAISANKAFSMKFSLHSFVYGSSDSLFAFLTVRAGDLEVVFFAVRAVVVTMKLIPSELRVTFRADEVIFMPVLAHGLNVLPLDDFLTVSTARAELLPVVILAV